ncbi:MAG TPA: phosphodiester glycosidase family protein [Tepidisphaeraceae bacterium]|nr:phosphodiester glycosidase family protein [Tepidisphaeraceae bacterium]
MFNISATNVPGVFTAGGAGSTGVVGGTHLYNAIGGNQRILTNGVVTAPDNSYTNTLNPHTAIATNVDRTRVYLMTVDGRQNGYSEGMRTTEMATLFLQFGATDAVNLDGGGSTTMVMDDSNDNLQNARLINSPSDGATPQQAGNERLVANNLAVFAQHNPHYVPLPPVARPGAEDALPRLQNLTILDSFDSSKGRFNSAPSTSGSNRNVATTSSTTLDTEHKQSGNSSLRLNIVSTNGSTPQMQLRLLSGGGSPSNNTVGGETVGPNGYIGFFLRLEPGNAPLYVSMLLDDGLLAGHGTERASFKQVIADGQWHLYEWALSDPNQWVNFANGNARIDGPNVFLDSIYFSSAPATSGGTNWSGSVWIDTVAYNPNGSLSVLVPEPGMLSMLLLATPALLRRARRAA